jgi:phosphate transport system permease protein
MVSGNAAIMSLDPSLPVRTMAATIAAELGEVVFGSGHYRVLFLLGALLFIFTSLLNWAGDRYRRRLRLKLFGAE